MTLRERIVCFLGFHPEYEGREFHDGSFPREVHWCTRCGRTYEPTYDGFAAGWARRGDMEFGEIQGP